MIVLIDNYDSFVHNLARYFRRLGQETLVVRNDAVDAAGVRRLRPRAVVLSPGPCTPNETGCSLDVVRRLGDDVPILGVCLGHQAIAAAMGGTIVRSAEPMHGRTSEVLHDGRGVFDGVANPITACRYHSLEVDEAGLPDCLEVSAWTASGVIMAIRHRRRPLVGLQFHPESILTEEGYRILAGFLQLAGLSPLLELPNMDQECRQPKTVSGPLPSLPVTF